MRLCIDRYSTVNLITDNLQRTCTGTVIIDLDGSGWVTSTDTNTSGGGGSTGGGGSAGSGTSENTSTEETQVTTGSWENGNNGGGDNNNGGDGTGTYDGNDGDGSDRQRGGDNVHLGPAGIGLLVMGFLILGCKYFNTSFGMGLSKKVGKEIRFFIL